MTWADDRHLAVELAEQIGISEHLLNTAKLETGWSWGRVLERLEEQLAAAYEGAQITLDPDLPDIFNFYHAGS